MAGSIWKGPRRGETSLQEYGPYHRVSARTQTAEDARRIKASGELWGLPPRGSDMPQVQAWVGPLPPGATGIKFMTMVAPVPGTPPHEARWRPGRTEVRLEPEADQLFAKIAIRLTRTTFRK